MDSVVLRRCTGGCHRSQVTQRPPSGPPTRPDLLSAEKLPPAPTQDRSRQKRALILAAALRLFSAKGYRSASMAAVAREAGTPVGTVYQHFRSKRQLLLVLIDELLRRLEAIRLSLEGAPDVRTGIRRLLEAGFRADLEYVGAYRAWREAIATDRLLARRNRDIEAWTTGRLTMAFLALGGLPGARRDVEASALARVIDRWFWDLLARPIEPMDQTLDLVSDVLYHALFCDNAEIAD
jgi:AcrR family transcriptional regulator